MSLYVEGLIRNDFYEQRGQVSVSPNSEKIVDNW